MMTDNNCLWFSKRHGEYNFSQEIIIYRIIILFLIHDIKNYIEKGYVSKVIIDEKLKYTIYFYELFFRRF